MYLMAIFYVITAFCAPATSAFALPYPQEFILAKRGRFTPQTPCAPPLAVSKESFLLAKVDDTNSNDIQQPPSSAQFSLPYLSVYVALLIFSFFLAPGQLNSPDDMQLIATLTKPETYQDPGLAGVNQVWFAIWNLFGVVPLVLSALVLPGPPINTGGFHKSSPFLLGSSALGYFALGPYMITRPSLAESESLQPKTKADLGFFTRNIFESKIFGAILLLLSLSVGSQLLPALGDFSVLSDFSTLLFSSRFVSVACVDLFILTTICSVLVGEDAERRGADPNLLQFVPIFGPVLWLITRPPIGGNNSVNDDDM